MLKNAVSRLTTVELNDKKALTPLFLFRKFRVEASFLLLFHVQTTESGSYGTKIFLSKSFYGIPAAPNAVSSIAFAQSLKTDQNGRNPASKVTMTITRRLIRKK
jgi:hypothetical protein